MIRQQGPSPPLSNPGLAYLTNFTRQKPPSFVGKPDPILAEEWLMKVEKIMNALRIHKDEDKVLLATYMFKSEAKQWWRDQQQTRDISSLTWEDFKELFFEKYFPHTKREKKSKDFRELQQGSMTGAEYTAKFLQLSRYFP